MNTKKYSSEEDKYSVGGDDSMSGNAGANSIIGGLGDDSILGSE